MKTMQCEPFHLEFYVKVMRFQSFEDQNVTNPSFQGLAEDFPETKCVAQNFREVYGLYAKFAGVGVTRATWPKPIG